MHRTIRTILAAGFVAVSMLSTTQFTSAATNNPVNPSTQTEESGQDLHTFDMPVDTDQPAEEPRDMAAERYRRVLEELRLPDAEDLRDGSTSQAERQ